MALKIERDLTLYGECPKCGTPGLHLMPRRVLVSKLTQTELTRRRERVEVAEQEYVLSSRLSYRYLSHRGSQVEYEYERLQAERRKYHEAQEAAEQCTYALERVCYVDDCRHTWHELIRKIKSDAVADTLRKRYPEGLVVRPA